MKNSCVRVKPSIPKAKPGSNRLCADSDYSVAFQTGLKRVMTRLNVEIVKRSDIVVLVKRRGYFKFDGFSGCSELHLRLSQSFQSSSAIGTKIQKSKFPVA